MSVNLFCNLVFKVRNAFSIMPMSGNCGWDIVCGFPLCGLSRCIVLFEDIVPPCLNLCNDRPKAKV